MKIKMLAMAFIMMISLVWHPGFSTTTAEGAEAARIPYLIELSRFGIYNNGTHPVETTKGINAALQWAHQNNIQAASLPSGKYLIDKNSRINMVGNMRFELPSDAVLQKETNGREAYEIMYIGYGADNVTLKGGTYRGDKDTHDFTKKDSPHTSGTHESGYGIQTQGAINLTIDGIKAINLTGDGLALGGKNTLVKDLYEGNFVSGGIDDLGRPVADAKKIRTKAQLDFSNPIFKTERQFELANPVNLPNVVDLVFYNAAGGFIKKLPNVKMRDLIDIPAKASSFHLVYAKAGTKGAYMEFWNRALTRNALVTNSEFAFNRRQGITVGGADKVTISKNILHDIKGVAPQSGIDVEGGFGENGNRNSNINIKNNRFYNNAAYDVILYDGRDAVVEGNELGSKGAIGLAVSEPFTGARVINNHFDGSRISATNDAAFIGNQMNDSYTYFEGPNITIDGMVLKDSRFAVTSKVPFGVSVSNIMMYNNKKSDSGLAVWGQPIRITNMTIHGEPTLRAVVGGAVGSIFDNLKVLGFNSEYGLSLPPGTYNGCMLEGAEGGKFGSIQAVAGGKYVFDKCTFISNSTVNTNFLGEHPQLDLTIKNSVFKVRGNSQAINVQAAANVTLENNSITADKLTSTSMELIKLNDYWKRGDPFDILKASVVGNRVDSNIAAVGISTVNAGVGAPAYTIKNNSLHAAILSLKSNDKASGNTKS